MSIETQLTLILAVVLLGSAWALSLVAHGIIRLARGPQPQEDRGPNLDDALPRRRGALRERAGRAGSAAGAYAGRTASAAGALAIYLVATVATAAQRAWRWLDETRKHIPGSVTMGLVAPGPALTEVFRESSSHVTPKRAA